MAAVPGVTHQRTPGILKGMGRISPEMAFCLTAAVSTANHCPHLRMSPDPPAFIITCDTSGGEVLLRLM